MPTDVVGARWWRFDFHTHTPASICTAWNKLIGTDDELTPEDCGAWGRLGELHESIAEEAGKGTPDYEAHSLPWDQVYLLVISPDLAAQASRWAAAARQLNPATDLTTVVNLRG